MVTLNIFTYVLDHFTIHTALLFFLFLASVHTAKTSPLPVCPSAKATPDNPLLLSLSYLHFFFVCSYFLIFAAMAVLGHHKSETRHSESKNIYAAISKIFFWKQKKVWGKKEKTFLKENIQYFRLQIWHFFLYTLHFVCKLKKCNLKLRLEEWWHINPSIVLLSILLWGNSWLLAPPPAGDFDQKPYVSPDADSSTVRLQGNEDYVLLACDGFFDAVQPSEVPQLVMGALQELPLPEGAAEAPPDSGMGQTVAQKLVASAKEAGSSDNITVMLVFLRPLLELASATRGRCAAPQTPAEAAASQEEAETWAAQPSGWCQQRLQFVQDQPSPDPSSLDLQNSGPSCSGLCCRLHSLILLSPTELSFISISQFVSSPDPAQERFCEKVAKTWRQTCRGSGSVTAAPVCMCGSLHGLVERPPQQCLHRAG